MGAPQSSRSTQARRHLAIHEDHLGGVTDRDRPAVIEAAGMLPAITFTVHGSDSNSSVTNAELLEARSHELLHEPFG